MKPDEREKFERVKVAVAAAAVLVAGVEEAKGEITLDQATELYRQTMAANAAAVALQRRVAGMAEPERG